jgi:ATP-dependent DNA helicase RecG
VGGGAKRTEDPDAPLHAVALELLGGVGPARKERLAVLGIRNVHELLCTLPRRVERWPGWTSLAGVKALAAPKLNAGTAEEDSQDDGEDHDGSEEPLRVRGSVVRFRFSRFAGRSLVRATLSDPSGELDVLFFNQPWLRERFRKGDELDVLGRPTWAGGAAFVASRLGFADSPLPAPGTLTPVYASTEGLSQEMLRTLCLQALERFGARLTEPIPAAVLAEHDLPPLPEAVKEIHAPTGELQFVRARRRLGLEPLLALQAGIAARRAARKRTAALALECDERLALELERHFPFEFTRGQREVVGELREDLARGIPMRRLVQGDVGSGKTAVGAWACLLTARAGAQCAFLAPTELLAEQHFRGLSGLFERAGLRTALLVGSLRAAARREVLEGLESGALAVVFGTHSLLGSPVKFARLALAVIDEQHRFGVAQRERLFDKGRDVHGLLMTATPIPRSLALTIYGDLDVSTLREKPPGRSRIETRRIQAPRDLIELLEPRLERGERVYWVVPRIDGEEEDAPGAEQRFARIAKGPWARYGVELAHGRLASEERGARLERFRRGEARVLVATTVIEVGVDVPEATAIVVESAERLGLAQLHQLRGRVGRGRLASACYLMGKRSAAERLELLERCDDGFEIAEEDLRRRGMGDLLGLRQAGENLEGFDGEGFDLALFDTARRLVAAQPGLVERYGAARPLS